MQENRELTVTRLSTGKERNVFIDRVQCREFDSLMASFPGPIIVYDLETTGLKGLYDRIVQAAAVKLERNEKGCYRPTDSLNLLIKPKFPMPKDAADVNHITDEVLKDAPYEEEIFPKIEQFFAGVNEGTTAVAGYNLKFDNKRMESLYIRCGRPPFRPIIVIDAMKMSKEMVDPKNLEERKFTQEHVADFLGLREETMHDAFTDVKVSGNILSRLYGDYVRDFRVPKDYYQGRQRLRIVSMKHQMFSKENNYVNIQVAGVKNGEPVIGMIRYEIYYDRFTEEPDGFLPCSDLKRFLVDAEDYADGPLRSFGRKR